MPISATFVPDSISVVPTAETPLALEVHNGDDERRVLTIAPVGELAGDLTLGVSSVALEPGETFEVPVTITVSPVVVPGPHLAEVRVTGGADATAWAEDGAAAVPDSIVATLTVEVVSFAEHTVALVPVSSHGSARGRHAVRVANHGNVPVTVGLAADHLDSPVSLDIAPSVTVEAGGEAEVALLVVPTSRFWSGPEIQHPFVVSTTGDDGVTFELAGDFVQRPRVPSWLGPALAGAGIALLLGTIIWFALLKPWIEDAASSAAEDALAADRAALEELIDELEASAAEAEELPLGTPTDLRLDVAAAGGNIGAARETVPSGSTVSITDVVLQNPTGAVGIVRLTRDGEVLLESQLANFRDLDLHFVAPYVFEGGSEIALELDCRTAGPGLDECTVGASLVGFVD